MCHTSPTLRRRRHGRIHSPVDSPRCTMPPRARPLYLSAFPTGCTPDSLPAAHLDSLRAAPPIPYGQHRRFLIDGAVLQAPLLGSLPVAPSIHRQHLWVAPLTGGIVDSRQIPYGRHHRIPIGSAPIAHRRRHRWANPYGQHHVPPTGDVADAYGRHPHVYAATAATSTMRASLGWRSPYRRRSQ